MKQEAPLLEFPHAEPDGLFDVVAHAQNGLAAVEARRQRVTAQIDQAWEEPLARARQKEQAAMDRAARLDNIQYLRLGTLAEDPTIAANYQRQLDEALVEYHRDRAAALGSRVTELTVERPRFAGIRTRIAEMRQTYHQSRA